MKISVPLRTCLAVRPWSCSSPLVFKITINHLTCRHRWTDLIRSDPKEGGVCLGQAHPRCKTKRMILCLPASSTALRANLCDLRTPHRSWPWRGRAPPHKAGHLRLQKRQGVREKAGRLIRAFHRGAGTRRVTSPKARLQGKGAELCTLCA